MSFSDTRIPNVVKLYEHGKYTENAFEYVYLVMDLVDGNTLTASIGNIDEAAAIKLTKSILETIGSIHDDGVLHRDLKPENIMVKPDGTREAKSFEPLQTISDWLLSGSDTDWLFTKTDASMIGFVPQYQL